MSETVCIATFSSREEAGLACSLLESHGIRAMVSADDAGGMFMPLPYGVKLFVLDEQADAARKLLEHNDADTPD